MHAIWKFGLLLLSFEVSATRFEDSFIAGHRNNTTKTQRVCVHVVAECVMGNNLCKQSV